ncbi:hypothetical protein DF186_14775, partial [Enterococcus hirae]
PLINITNYITFNHNQPLHIFNTNKIINNLTIHQTKNNKIN